MSKLFASAAVLAILAAAPAAAITYDGFASFNGVNGNGNFSYGYTDGVTLTSFAGSGRGAGVCALGVGATCLYLVPGDVPLASIGGNLASVTIPTDAVLIHPGDSELQSVYSAFVATSAGSYNYTIDLKSVGTDTTNGIGYRTFTALGGVVTLGSRGVLATYLSSVSLTGSQALSFGEVFGVIVDRNGSHGGDSTGISFNLSTIPEPATWGLMIAGFAMVGFAARRPRRKIVSA